MEKQLKQIELDEKPDSQSKGRYRERLNSQIKAMKGNDRDDAIQAIRIIAETALTSTTMLEELSHLQPDLLKEIASDYSHWPVNIQMKKEPGNKGLRIHGKKFAEDYLKDLGVGTGDTQHESLYYPGRTQSLYGMAAKSILRDLLEMRSSSYEFFDTDITRATSHRTPWQKQVMTLSPPMTQENVDQWWSVAKEYLDNTWNDEVERERVFLPLINCSVKDVEDIKHAPATVRKRIIDDRLKKSFKALAAPPPR